MVNGPVLFTEDNIGQGLAFGDGDDDTVGKAALDRDLVDIRKFGKNAAQGGKSVKEKQVVALFYINGSDDFSKGGLIFD